jgi:hypothetical protein
LKLSNSFKILVAGSALAALVAGSGAAMNAVDKKVSRAAVPAAQARVKELEADCKAESTQQAAAAKAANSPLAGFSLVCDPVYLKNDVDTAPAGAQKDLGAAQLVLETAIARTNGPSILWPYALAAMIGVFSAVPWFWYFLLRRLAELRQAVLGR